MSAPGFSGNQRIVDIPANTVTPFTSILAQSSVSKLVVEESPITSTGAANTLQGVLQYQLPNDGTANGFTTIFQKDGANTITTQGEIAVAQIVLEGNPNRFGQPQIIGQVGQQIIGASALTAATTMIKLRSGTGTGTSVIVRELN